MFSARMIYTAARVSKVPGSIIMKSLTRILLLLAIVGPASAGTYTPDFERGRALYERHCQHCHTADIHSRPNQLPLTRDELAGIVDHFRRTENWMDPGGNRRCSGVSEPDALSLRSKMICHQEEHHAQDTGCSGRVRMFTTCAAVFDRSAEETVRASGHSRALRSAATNGTPSGIVKPERLARMRQDEAEAATRPAHDLLAEAGLPHKVEVQVGDPAEMITRYAKVHECDEIVMGTRGLGTIKSLVIGSVAYKVVHLTDRPVLLVK